MDTLWSVCESASQMSDMRSPFIAFRRSLIYPLALLSKPACCCNVGVLFPCIALPPVFIKHQISRFQRCLNCVYAAVPRLVAMMMPPAALPCREQAAWGMHCPTLSPFVAVTVLTLSRLWHLSRLTSCCSQPLQTSPAMVRTLGKLSSLQASCRS
jgi:hypothetical protein